MTANQFKQIAMLLLLVTGAFSSNLDKESIKELYFDGEFKAVADGLESFLEAEEDLSDEDRIFAYKYLSVVYAANPDTRKKAESYMYQLLKLAPTIKLLDMYISENIQLIFEKVRKHFDETQEYAQKYDDYGRPIMDTEQTGANANIPAPAKSGNANSKHHRNRAWFYWTAGITGAAVLGGTGYFIFAHDPDPKVTYTKGKF